MTKTIYPKCKSENIGQESLHPHLVFCEDCAFTAEPHGFNKRWVREETIHDCKKSAKEEAYDFVQWFIKQSSDLKLSNTQWMIKFEKEGRFR